LVGICFYSALSKLFKGISTAPEPAIKTKYGSISVYRYGTGGLHHRHPIFNGKFSQWSTFNGPHLF
jgi:hypothetical protein